MTKDQKAARKNIKIRNKMKIMKKQKKGAVKQAKKES